MRCFLQAAHVRDVDVFVENLLKSTSGVQRAVFDYMLERDSAGVTRIIAHYRCDEQNLWRVCGSEFSNYFLRWALYGGEIPVAYTVNERLMTGRTIQALAPSAAEILSSGDEISVAELLVKYFAVNGATCVFSRADDAVNIRTCVKSRRFDVLHDNRIVLDIYQGSYVGADPERVARLLYPIVGTAFVYNAFSMLSFTKTVNLTRNPPRGYNDRLQSVIQALKTGKTGLPSEADLHFITENYTDGALHASPREFAMLLAVVLREAHEISIFTKKSFACYKIEISTHAYLEIKKAITPLAPRIATAFLMPELAPDFLGMAHGECIVELTLLFPDRFCLQEVIYWRALYDGPLFIAYLLTALQAGDKIARVSTKMLIDVFTVCQRLPWMYGEGGQVEESRAQLMRLNYAVYAYRNISLLEASTHMSKRFLNNVVRQMAHPLINMLSDVVFDTEAAADALFAPLIPYIGFTDEAFPCFRPSYSGYLVLLYVIHASTSMLVDASTPFRAKSRVASFLVLLCSKYNLLLSLSPRWILGADDADCGVFCACLYALRRFLGSFDEAAAELRACDERKKSLEYRVRRLRAAIDSTPADKLRKIQYLAEQRAEIALKKTRFLDELSRCELSSVEFVRYRCAELRHNLQLLETYSVQLSAELEQFGALGARCISEIEELDDLLKEHRKTLKDSKELSCAIQQMKDAASSLMNATALKGCPFLLEYYAPCVSLAGFQKAPQIDRFKFQTCIFSGPGFGVYRETAKRIAAGKLALDCVYFDVNLARALILETKCLFYGVCSGGLFKFEPSQRLTELSYYLLRLADALGVALPRTKWFPSVSEMDFVFLMVYSFYSACEEMFFTFAKFFTSFCYSIILETGSVPAHLQTLIYNYSLLLNVLDERYYRYSRSAQPSKHCTEIFTDFQLLVDTLAEFDVTALEDYTPTLYVCSTLFEHLPTQITMPIVQRRQKSHLLKIASYFKTYEEHFHECEKLKQALSCLCTECSSLCIGSSIFEILGYEAFQLYKLWSAVSWSLNDTYLKALSHAALGVVNQQLYCYSNPDSVSTDALYQLALKLSWLQ